MPKNVKRSSARHFVDEAMELYDELKRRRPDKAELIGEATDVIYRMCKALRPYGVFPRHIKAEFNRRAEAGESLDVSELRERKKKKKIRGR